MANISIRSDENWEDDDSSVDQLFAEIDGSTVILVLVGDIDEDISSLESGSKSIKASAVEIAKINDFSVVLGKSLDDWLVDGSQKVSSSDWRVSLGEFEITKSVVCHISVVGDSDSVART